MRPWQDGHGSRWESTDQLFPPPGSGGGGGGGGAIRRADLLFGLPVLHSSSRCSPKLLDLHSTVKLNITNFVDIISQPNNLMCILRVCSISTELRRIFKSQRVMDSAEGNLCVAQASAQLRRGCAVKISLKAAIRMGPSQPGSISLSLLPPPPTTFQHALTKHSSLPL